MPSAAPTARLEAHISTELHAMLKRPAEIQGRSLTDFVVSAAQEAAQRAIEQGKVVRLSLADSERFAQALLSPPDPPPALERAFACMPLRPSLKAQVKTSRPRAVCWDRFRPVLQLPAFGRLHACPCTSTSSRW